MHIFLHTLVFVRWCLEMSPGRWHWEDWNATRYEFTSLYWQLFNEQSLTLSLTRGTPLTRGWGRVLPRGRTAARGQSACSHGMLWLPLIRAVLPARISGGVGGSGRAHRKSVRPRRSLVGSPRFESRTPFHGWASSEGRRAVANGGVLPPGDGEWKLGPWSHWILPPLQKIKLSLLWCHF